MEIRVSQVGITLLCYLPRNFPRPTNGSKSAAESGNGHRYVEPFTDKCCHLIQVKPWIFDKLVAKVLVVFVVLEFTMPS